jgi:hypothetical protein
VREPSFDLEPGEELITSVPASFRGATATSTRSMFALGSARMRQRSFEQWRNLVEGGGFPTAGPEMILTLTTQRLAVFHTTFFANRPSSLGGTIELRRILQVATARRGMVTSLAFVLADGSVVEVEAMRGARLRRFADHVRTAIEDSAAR